MTQQRTPTWPDTTHDEPPADQLYRSATWLLGRHRRLAQLTGRIAGAGQVDEDDGGLSIDLDHPGDVFAAVPQYNAAREEYKARNRPPDDEDAYYRWQEAGPKADDVAAGLRDLLVMSSGEVAYLRLLATLGSIRVPVKISDLRSLNDEGARLLADWCRAGQAA